LAEYQGKSPLFLASLRGLFDGPGSKLAVIPISRAYGSPNAAVSPEPWQAVQVAAVKELHGMGRPAVPVAEAYDALGGLDGYARTESDIVTSSATESRSPDSF
jgi:hypothetical protein